MAPPPSQLLPSYWSHPPSWPRLLHVSPSPIGHNNALAPPPLSAPPPHWSWPRPPDTSPSPYWLHPIVAPPPYCPLHPHWLLTGGTRVLTTPPDSYPLPPIGRPLLATPPTATLPRCSTLIGHTPHWPRPLIAPPPSWAWLHLPPPSLSLQSPPFYLLTPLPLAPPPPRCNQSQNPSHP